MWHSIRAELFDSVRPTEDFESEKPPGVTGELETEPPEGRDVQ